MFNIFFFCKRAWFVYWIIAMNGHMKNHVVLLRDNDWSISCWESWQCQEEKLMKFKIIYAKKYVNKYSWNTC